MISQLINTLLLALGVATGNVSSNVYKGGNAFNHEITKHEEKPNKKNLTEYTYTQTLGVRDVSTIYGPRVDQNSPVLEYTWIKYYLYEGNQEESTTITLPNMMLTNTLYTFTWKSGNPSTSVEQFLILKIKNIFNGTNTFQTKIRLTINHTTRAYATYTYTSDDEDIDQLIDMTMTANARQNFRDILYNENTELTETSQTSGTPQYATNSEITATTPQISLEQNETKYVITRIDVTATQETMPITYQDLTINGDYIAPEINYEIVDIPNLMYTILTMPFAFYSTAFNLTIFPNTPYSVNFGNLILTIIGALILFYLIKKVIK